MRPAGETGRAALSLVGDPGVAMPVAVEMVRGHEARISVGHEPASVCADCERSADDLVHVRISVDLPDLVARLRGECPAGSDFCAGVRTLVGSRISEVERELILQTLDHCGGNRTSAASMLGISIRTMRNKLRAFVAEGMIEPYAAAGH